MTASCHRATIFSLIGVFTVLILLSLPIAARAISFENAGPLFGMGDVDFKQALINFINFVLGLLGLIALIMVLIGGFRWLVSMGEEEKIAVAKKTISGALIGMVLVLLSWAIVGFVLRTTANVSGAS